MLPVVKSFCGEVAYYRFRGFALHPSRCGVDLGGEVAVRDGVRHGCFAWCSLWHWLFSAVAARFRLRFSESILIDAGSQISMYATETCGSGCVIARFVFGCADWLAACKTLASSAGTHLRRNGPRDAFRPFPILHRSARAGRRPSPKKNSERPNLADARPTPQAAIPLRTCSCAPALPITRCVTARATQRRGPTRDPPLPRRELRCTPSPRYSESDRCNTHY